MLGEEKMFNFEHTVNGNIDLEKAWRFYSDVSCWKEWDHGIESVEIEGEFIKGNIGVMKLKSGQAFPFTIGNVIPMSKFSTIADLGGYVITFGHTITSSSITHTVEVVGDDATQVEWFGKTVTANVAENMDRLLALAQK